jgi:citrate synthase
MPVNVDGAIAAIICEMGVPSELADALFILARTAGLIKQSREEAAQSTTYKRG